MKKTLIALAALGVVGAASAQATVSGEISAGISKSADGSAGVAMHDLDVNFNASEDLGGGMSVAGKVGIEGSQRKGNVTISSGSLSLSGGFGTVAFGTAGAGSNRLASNVNTPYDMSTAMGGTATGVTGLQTFDYTLPAFGPVTVKMGYSKGGTTGGNDAASNPIPLKGWDDASTSNVNVAYADGPLTGSINYRKLGKRTRYAVGYDLGTAKVDVAFGSDKQTELLVRVPMGALTVDLHTGSTEVTGKMASGKTKASAMGAAVDYALSKRTSLRYAVISIKDSVYSGANGSSYRLELSHKF